MRESTDKEQALERLRQLVNSNWGNEIKVTINYDSCPPKTDTSLKNTYRDNNALGYGPGIPPYRIEKADQERRRAKKMNESRCPMCRKQMEEKIRSEERMKYWDSKTISLVTAIAVSAITSVIMCLLALR